MISSHNMSESSDENLEKTVMSSTLEEGRLPVEFEDKKIMDLEEDIQRLLDDSDTTDCFLVAIDPDSPEFPKNWPFSLKIKLTMVYGITTMCAQFNSSIMAPVWPHLSEQFGVSHTVAILPTSLYIIGVAFGPIIFGPVSEVYGRKIGILIPFFISIVFTVATGASTKIEAIIINRFFAGLFAAAPVVSSGGVLADIWEPAVRGNSLVLYASFVVLGPSLGSVIGSIIAVKAQWQWTCWVSAIFSGVVLVLDILTVKESYVPVLNCKLARRVRASKKNWLYHAKHEEWELTFKEFLSVHLVRPFAMFGTPIVFFIAMYASFVFGVFYLFLTSAAQTFRTVRGWGEITSSLSYIAMFLGTAVGGCFNILGGIRYKRIVNKVGKGHAIPEERLYPMMLVGWLMPVGIFLFAWTQRTSQPWIAPFIGLALYGCGFFVTFQGCLNYLVDTFSRFSASAVSANTFSRSLFAGFFPLFGYHLFENLGTDWGGSLLAFVSLALLPIPFVFYKFGERIRAKNPYSHLVQ